MCINLGQCVNHTTSDESSKFDVGNKTNIKIYIDKEKKNTLCLEVEILVNESHSSYKLAKILKIGNSTDKNLFKQFISKKSLHEGSTVKFV
ncbi:MAG TPA: hypothetical protein QF753_05475 [Victivallales bacterium]|nr:hypothetical protein [Victivallales bacterium]